MEQIVFIGAHPDDFSASCGTALLLKEKFGLHIWDFTKGERGLQSQGVALAECGARREAEEQRVANYLGAELFFCDEIDGEAYASRETCARMAAKLRQLQPRAIITHALADVHGDHLMTAVATLKAVQLAQIQPEIYSFEFSYQSRAFAPRYYVDITPMIAEKIKVVRMYDSQNAEDILVNNQLQTASFRGRQIQVEYAEAFGAYDNFCNGNHTIFSEF